MADGILRSAARRGLRSVLSSGLIRAAVLDDPKLARMTWNLALQAMGYNNYTSLAASGEAELIRRIAGMGANGTAVDVGANSGSYAECLLEHGFLRVVAYEPHPAHADRLEQLRVRFGGRFEWHPVACGNAQGYAELLFDPDALSHASLLSEVNEIPYVTNSDALTVPVEPIDRLVPAAAITDIDLLKIDVEGSEDLVLRGATETLERLRPRFVQLEFNVHQLLVGSSLHRLSQSLPGYSVGQLLPGARGLREVRPLDADANVFAYSNFVFCRDQSDARFLAR